MKHVVTHHVEGSLAPESTDSDQPVPSNWKTTDYFPTGLDKFHYVAHHGRRERDSRTFRIVTASSTKERSPSFFYPNVIFLRSGRFKYHFN